MSTPLLKYVLCSAVLYAPMVFAQDATDTAVEATSSADESATSTTPSDAQVDQPHKKPRSHTIETLKNIHKDQLKVDAKAAQPEAVKDPLQPLNRKIYHFNDTLDKHVVRPVAVQYKEKIPEDVRGGFSNFRNNMRDPWNSTNQMLQGKPKKSFKTLGKFVLNTVTSLGMADIAKRKNLTSENETFGNTLGVWGVPSGPYIVLPMFGPSTFRDGFGMLAVDTFARPQGYLYKDDKIFWSMVALEGIDSRAQFLELDSVVQGDQYAALRDVYLQRRNYDIAVRRGEDPTTDMFMEDSFDDDGTTIDDQDNETSTDDPQLQDDANQNPLPTQ
ncbi:phospholipid-binding lipoprotein MlaA [Acinetobacter marinus]|uniref:Phospholipid-binding lipoprotein MlaA n=1 Tax=Acinetobacter marinus TaxID=281375 RepID=A0A1G6HUT4_9GAMM|nr:VacJ family lipoprotein [Acinetobacter marinus]SDB98059.1 phospholipid-binding lipoprotein MlaA [Acinetobacter marinus]